MTHFVKICGITSKDAADTAVSAGADALGFVFAGSPRKLSPTRASEIADGLPDHVEKIAVFRRPHHDAIKAVIEAFDADTVQADWSSLVGFEVLPVLPVVRDGCAPDFDGRRILFEGRRSGVGELADWSTAERLARQSQLVLAGGLDVQNVGSAVESVRPFGVDVSSGVESAVGIKHNGMVREFVNQVREIEERMVKT